MQSAHNFIKTYASGTKQHDVVVTVQYKRPKLAIAPLKKQEESWHSTPVLTKEEQAICDMATD